MKNWKRKDKNISAHTEIKVNKIAEDKRLNLSLPLILILTFLIFSPCLKNGFLTYDDTENVRDNILITSLNFHHLKIFFTTPLLFMYTPFVYISFALDYKIAGLQPLIFHLTNLLIHILNVSLVYIFIKTLTDKKENALIATALFAVHPVNADAVAWISARSTLLFSFFFLASLIFYLHYLKNNSGIKFYFISILFFIFSCLSKSAAVVLPVVLILLDYRAKRKITLKSLLEKIPFFLISIAAGVLTLYFRSDEATIQLPYDYTVIDKFFIFFFSLTTYFFRFIFPFNLSPIYTYPSKNHQALPILFYISFLVIPLLIYFIYHSKKTKRELIFGSLFFLITVSINQIGFLEDGFTANRYAYLPCIGFFFIVGNFFPRIQKKTFLILFLVFITISSGITFQNVQTWKDSVTLFDDVIKKEPDNAFAYNSRGIAKYEIHDYKGSIEDYTHAIELNEKYPGAFYNRAISNYEMGNFSKSLEDYSNAIGSNPQSAKSYMGRGIIKMDVMKNFKEAIADYDKAIQLNPDFAQAYYNRGLAKHNLENNPGACDDWKKVKLLGYSRADELIQLYCH